MQRSWKDFLVGITVIVGLVGIGVLLLYFGEFEGVRQRTYGIFLRLPDATGLSSASRVTLNGVEIGNIHSITIADSADPAQGVLIALKVVEGIRVPRNAEITLERGLVGEAALAMVARPTGAVTDADFISPGETYVTTAQGFFDAIAGMIDKRLAAFTDAAKAVEKLSDTYTQVGEQAKTLLQQHPLDEVDAGQAQPNIATTIARLDRTVKAAEAWLGDDKLRTDISTAAARLTTVLDEAAKAVDAWTATARTVDTQAANLGEEARTTLRDFAQSTKALNDTMLEVQTLVARVNRGEGTAGQLVTNPDLYNSVTDAATRLEKALTEAQLLFEKYRKEGLPIHF